MIKTILPSSTVLSKYIAYFYVFTNEYNNSIRYITFPSAYSGISLFRGVNVTRGDHQINIDEKENAKELVSVEITGKYTQPVFINYNGEFNEISIIFKPLGVNRFLKDDLIEYAPLFSQPLKLIQWQSIAEELFQEKTLSKQIEKLESFLLDNFREKEDHTMRKALLLIEDIENDHTIQEIANQCGLTLKTFQRNFKKLLTCTPSEYKRIVRFRHSITNKMLNEAVSKLTDVAHDSMYYDQSYFIREYKKLTGTKPKIFFNRASVLTEDKIIWQFR
jgi:AraC-like DNA-binding protein